MSDSNNFSVIQSDVYDDKINHFLGSMALVWFFFIILSVYDYYSTSIYNHNTMLRPLLIPNICCCCCCCCCFSREWREAVGAAFIHHHGYRFFHRLLWILLYSSAISIFVGLEKEFYDWIWDGWPWCDPTCHADLRDLVANIIGVLFASLLLLLILLILLQLKIHSGLQLHEEQQQQRSNSIHTTEIESVSSGHGSVGSSAVRRRSSAIVTSDNDNDDREQGEHNLEQQGEQNDNNNANNNNARFPHIISSESISINEAMENNYDLEEPKQKPDSNNDFEQKSSGGNAVSPILDS